MYLLALNSTDYIFITLFFAIIAITAYIFRNKNTTANQFLFGKTNVDGFLFYFGGFGIIEIVVAATLGSKLGLSIIYLGVFVNFLVVFIFTNILTHKYRAEGVGNFNDFIASQLGPVTSTVIAMLTVITFILLGVIAEEITFNLLHFLLGWNFVNSIISVLVLLLITLIIGGGIGFKQNSVLLIVTIFITILITFTLVGTQTTSHELVDNLRNLARSNNLIPDYYSSLHLNVSSINMFILFILAYGGFYILNLSFNGFTAEDFFEKANYSNSLAFLIKSLLLVIFVGMGILAIGLQMPHKMLPNGKEVVTVQAVLPDGQTGYIVKAIDTNSPQLMQEPGLIPPLIDPKTGIKEEHKYNYNLASVVVFRQYLPKYLAFLIALFVISAFFMAFSSYVLKSAQIILRNIIIPHGFFEKFGENRELWVLRVSILAISVSITAISEIYLPYFVFIQALYWVATILFVPLFATMFLCILSNGSKSYIAILGGIALSIILNITINFNDEIHKCVLIATVTFLVIFIGGIILNALEKSQHETI